MRIRKNLVKSTVINFNNLMANLGKLNEEETKYALDLEMDKQAPRAVFCVRLHARFSSLRRDRERLELLETIDKKNKK